MATSRYVKSDILNNRKNFFGTAKLARQIFVACESGVIKCEVVILSEGQRLGHIAGVKYGDASLWWIIAAASGIGWGLQIPAGTIVRVPKNPNVVYEFI